MKVTVSIVPDPHQTIDMTKAGDICDAVIYALIDACDRGRMERGWERAQIDVQLNGGLAHYAERS